MGIKLSEFAAKYWRRYRPPVPAAILILRASIGVQMLGPRASNAVPELAGICDANISEPSRCGAIYALGGIGPAASNGVPALLRAASSTNAEVRIASLWALGMIHARPDEVVPVLVKLMQDTNRLSPATSPPLPLALGGSWRMTSGGFNTQLQAAYALSAYGPEAKAAVEPFMPVLTHLDAALRDRLYYYLEPISPEFAVRVVPTMTF